MIPYMVGKLAASSSHLTRRLVKYIPCRGYLRAVSSQHGDKFVTSPLPPPIVERVTHVLIYNCSSTGASFLLSSFALPRETKRCG